jgi:hypothetical protein
MESKARLRYSHGDYRGPSGRHTEGIGNARLATLMPKNGGVYASVGALVANTWWLGVFTGLALTSVSGAPCAAQQDPHSFRSLSWQAESLASPGFRAMLPFPASRSNKSLGLWVGFGIGVIAVPFAWSACEHGNGGCHTGEKMILAGALPITGAFLGSLIGRQFKKDSVEARGE